MTPYANEKMTLGNSANLTQWERINRMCIRNTYLAESLVTIRAEAARRGAKGEWFQSACLLELAAED